MSDAARMGVVAGEEGVVRQLTKAVAALRTWPRTDVIPLPEHVHGHVRTLRDGAAHQQLACTWPEHLRLTHSERENGEMIICTVARKLLV